VVDCFLLVEMPENEMWFVSDNIVNRTHLLTLERTPQLVAQLTQMFEVMGYSVSVRNTVVKNRDEDVSKWLVDYDAYTDFNTRRFTLQHR
jgi:hypothetical protein